MLNDYERGKILGIYNPSNANSKKASRMLREEEVYVSSRSILKTWKKAGLEIKPPGGNNNHSSRRNRLEEQAIINVYSRYYGNARLASQSLSYTAERINEVWKRAGLREKRLEDKLNELILI